MIHNITKVTFLSKRLLAAMRERSSEVLLLIICAQIYSWAILRNQINGGDEGDSS